MMAGLIRDFVTRNKQLGLLQAPLKTTFADTSTSRFNLSLFRQIESLPPCKLEIQVICEVSGARKYRTMDGRKLGAFKGVSVADTTLPIF